MEENDRKDWKFRMSMEDAERISREAELDNYKPRLDRIWQVWSITVDYKAGIYVCDDLCFQSMVRDIAETKMRKIYQARHQTKTFVLVDHATKKADAALFSEADAVYFSNLKDGSSSN